MSKTTKSIILLIIILVVAMLNAVVVVDWLNKSLFEDYILDTEKAHHSFYNGVSLIFLLTMLIYSVVGTFVVSIIVTDILFGLLVIANHIKAIERNEFITFSELQTITSPRELLSFVEVSVTSATLIFIVTIIGILLLQWVAVKVAKKTNLLLHKKLRVVLLVISLTLLTVIYFKPNVYNEYVLQYKVSDMHNHDPLKRAQRDGFVPSFLHTVKPEYMDEPSQYAQSDINDIFDKYTSLSEEINEERNRTLDDDQTILYLSESLIDPELVPDLMQNETPTPFITDIRNNNIGGTMYSQYIGGGTANIEWSLLTSFSLEVFYDPMSVTPYSDFYGDSNNHHTILSMFDSEKIALHPYTAHLYKRKSTYNAIGFDDFLYLDHGIQYTDRLGTHYRVSDESLNKDIFRFLGEEDIGLIQVLTMQNHAPFSREIPDMTYEPKFNTDIFSGKKEKELFNYLQGLKASDEAAEELITPIEESDEDVNILFYGDHFPNIFRGKEEHYTENELHETPWFLYMNHGRSENGVQMEGLSPIFFTTVLLREGNYEVTPFQALMDDLLSKDIKRIGDDFVVTKDGKVDDDDLSADRLELVEDYRLIVYDSLFGKGMLDDDFFLIAKE